MGCGKSKPKSGEVPESEAPATTNDDNSARPSFHRMATVDVKARKSRFGANILGENGTEEEEKTWKWSTNIVAELCVDDPTMHPFCHEEDFKRTWTEDCTVVSIVCRGITEKDLSRGQDSNREASIGKALGVLKGLIKSGRLGFNTKLVGLTADMGKWTFAEESIRKIASDILFPNGTAKLILHVSALIPTAFAAYKNFEKVLCLTEARVEDFMEACHPGAKSQLHRIVVRSVKDLPDYSTLVDSGSPTEAFDNALCEMVEKAIAEEQNGANGEGIKAIVTSGRNLTLLSHGLMDYFAMPLFDQVKLIQFLSMGFSRSEFNRDERKDKQKTQVGVIRLDYHYPPAVGDAAHEDSFRFTTHFREVKELTFDRAQNGVFNDDITTNFTKALHELEDLNVVGISGDCGFMMHYQCFARFIAKKTPIFMSSLILAGTLSLMCTKQERVLCLTANDKTFVPMKEKLLKNSGIEADLDQFLIVGCADIPGFDAVAKGEKVDVPLVSKHMVPFLQELLAREKKEQPDRPIAYILLECTELPPYADCIRQSTGLPAYDCTSLIDFFHKCTSEKGWNTSGFAAHNPAFWNKKFSKDGVAKEPLFAPPKMTRTCI